MAITTNGQHITRDDLEQAFAQALGAGEQEARSQLPKIVAGAVAAAVTVIAVAYLLGRRRGRSRSALVEIRRL